MPHSRLSTPLVLAAAFAVAGCASRPAPPAARPAAAPVRPLDLAMITPPPPIPSGTPAPDFRTRTIDGATITRASLRGNVTLLDFWATWCPPCLMATPTIESLNREFGPKGLKVVGLSLDGEDTKPGIPRYKSRFHVTYPLAYSPTENLKAAKVFGLFHNPDTGEPSDGPSPPAVIVLDRKGIVRWSQVGYTPGEHAEIAQVIKRLLAEKA